MLALNWSDKTGESPATLQDFEVLFGNVVGVILGFAGITLFVLLIVGGFKFMTSGGDPKAVEEAKKTLTSAIAGLLIIIFSFLILQFIKDFTGVDVTVFKVFQGNP